MCKYRNSGHFIKFFRISFSFNNGKVKQKAQNDDALKPHKMLGNELNLKKIRIFFHEH